MALGPRTIAGALVAAGALFAIGGRAVAAPLVQRAIAIRGTVQSYVALTPVPEAWEFQLQAQTGAQSGSYRFRDPGYSAGAYAVQLDANARVKLRLVGGDVTVDSTGYAPTYSWRLAGDTPGQLLLTAESGDGSMHSYRPPGPADFYDSGGPVSHARISLEDFFIVSEGLVRTGRLEGALIVEVSEME